MSIIMRSNNRATPPPTNPRVLIVEDDASSRWAMEVLMKRLGYDCQVAADGREALKLARTFAPQVILMDLMMPVLDGLEATRRLKANDRTRGIPILALSGNVTPTGQANAFQAGCDDFMPKPVVLDALVNKLNQHLEGRTRES